MNIDQLIHELNFTKLKLSQANEKIETLTNELDFYKLKLNCRKKYFDNNPQNEMKKRNRDYIKNYLSNYFSKLNSILEKIGLIFFEIRITKIGNPLLPSLISIKEKEENLELKYRVPLDKALFLKDRYLMSDKMYMGFFSDLKIFFPTIYEIKAYRKRINSTLNLYQLNEIAIFTPFKEILKKRIRIHINEKQIKNDEVIYIRLAIDGTICSRSFSPINIILSIVGETCRLQTETITAGILRCEEDYEELKDSFVHIIKELEELQQIEYQNKLYQIQYTCCSDLKLMNEINGINGCNANYPCLWCHAHKNDFDKTDFKICRQKDFEKIKDIGLSKENLGYKNGSLLGSLISYFNCIVDTLHQRLRITDQLIKRLVKTLCIYDDYEGENIYDPAKHFYLDKWFKFVTKECKIYCKAITYNPKNSGGITRDFTGSEQIRIHEKLKKISLKSLFPELRNIEKINNLWVEFYFIDRLIANSAIKWNTAEYNSQVIKKRTQDWLQNYIECYSKNHVIPYMHIFACHLHEFIEKFGNISLWNAESIELLNNKTTEEYFRVTDKKNMLKQCLNRRRRIDIYYEKMHSLSESSY